MKTAISSFQGGSRLAQGRACADSVRAMSLMLGVLVLVGLPGCLRLGFGSGDDSDTRVSKNAAEAAISREVTEMVKLYRICLQKHEDNPVKAKRTAACTRMPSETWPRTI